MSSPPAVLAPVIALAQAGRLDDAVALLQADLTIARMELDLIRKGQAIA